MIRVLTLLARHGDEHYPDAVERLRESFRRSLPAAEHRILIVDNALPVGWHREVSDDVHVIGGSNRAWEFSAWDEAVDFLGDRLDGYDVVHLATSAFGQLYTRYLDFMDTRAALTTWRRGVAVGHLDYYDEPIALYGVENQCWLRSSYLFLTPAHVRCLGSFVAVASGPALFTGDPARPFRPDAPVSEGLRANIVRWLTGSAVHQGVVWHSHFSLSADTMDRFQSKATAILNEQMLTIRLRAIGCPTVDAIWLATSAVGGSSIECGRSVGPTVIPSWQEQVTTRGIDPAPAPLASGL